MIEQRLSKINFIGEDGFHWFIGQVTADPQWREFSTQYGYRAKVRILGHHPATNEVPDSELPWAHFLVPPNLGAGKNFGGTSFALQGGETVLGFFLDGDDMQQPVILGALFSGQAEKNIVTWNEAIQKGTTGFRPIDFNKQLNYSTAVLPSNGAAPVGNGVPGGGKTADGNESIQGFDNNELKNKIIGRAKKCKTGGGALGEIARALQSFIKIVKGLRQYKDLFIDPIVNEIVNITSLVGQTASLITGAFSAIIRQAISLLSPAERAALIMWEVEGRSTADIAEELGIKESTVRHTVARARASLRRILSELIIDEERGLTALDLLSTTYKKAAKIANKSSKLALTFILVLTAFLGLNSMTGNESNISEIAISSSQLSNAQDLPQASVIPESGEVITSVPSDSKPSFASRNDNFITTQEYSNHMLLASIQLETVVLMLEALDQIDDKDIPTE
jgi:RNA polymerase sigma factor (sigma-70 family)